jgi:hypothetical protein
MIVKLLLLVPLLTVIIYTIVGAIKREVWIAGFPRLKAVRLKESRALFFGFSFSIIYIFLIFYFINEMQLILDYKDWIIAVIFASLLTGLAIYLEKNLIKINTFKFKIVMLIILAAISFFKFGDLYNVLQN